MIKKERKDFTNIPFTLKQEIVHSFIHGFGILFGISSIPVLTVLAAKTGNITAIVGASIYSFCFLMMFTFSTLYHGFQHKQVKKVFEIFDHISIYFLISGTYTPFLLIYLNNSFGISLLVFLWLLTIAGIFFKVYYLGRYEFVSLVIYIAMGWIFIVGGKRFLSALPTDVMFFILTGGFLYSIGIVFYVWKKHFWDHAIWHSFVLAAAICHYVAVLLSV